MAKKKKSSKMTKTDAIRRALRQSKTGSPTEVKEILDKQGIKVTVAYVSTIKAADKKKKLTGGSRKPGRPASTSGGLKGKPQQLSKSELGEASELVLAAVELVLRVGGKQARDLVAKAEQMIAKVNEETKN